MFPKDLPAGLRIFKVVELKEGGTAVFADSLVRSTLCNDTIAQDFRIPAFLSCHKDIAK